MWEDSQWERGIREDGPIGGYFSGNGSFIRNHYVIWPEGLNGEYPNPYGTMEIHRVVNQAFDRRMNQTRTSFYQFVNFLDQVAEKEAAKEHRLITQKIAVLKKDGAVFSEEKMRDIETAVKLEQYGIAYKLIQEEDYSIQKMNEELKKDHNQSVFRDTEFFNSLFHKFLVRRISKLYTKKNGGYSRKAETVNIDSLVDEYFQELAKGAILETFEASKDMLKKSVLESLKKQHMVGEKANYQTSLFMEKTDKILDLAMTKINPPKGEKVRPVEDPIAWAAGKFLGPMTSGVMKGLGEEARTAGHLTRGSVAAGAGTALLTVKYHFDKKSYGALQEKTKQQKADVYAVELGSTTYDLSKFLKEAGDIFKKQSQQNYSELIDNLELYAKKQDISEIFLVEVNVKGYQSKHDVAIEGSGTFLRRMNNLVPLIANTEMPGLSVDKLIFLLNNTVPGAGTSDNIDMVRDYISALCVAWMWDDYTDIFRLQQNPDSRVSRIKLFSMNGQYFSASQVIRETRKRLINSAQSINFVKVSINPSRKNYDKKYASMKRQDNKSRISGDWQRKLQYRWDTMRNDVMRNSTMSIAFRQDELEKLLSPLYDMGFKP